MHWNILFIASVLVLAVTIIDAVIIGSRRYKRKRLLTPSRLLFAGTFLSAVLLFLPIYQAQFADGQAPFEGFEWLFNGGRAIFIAIQHAIRIFVLDGGYMELVNVLETELKDLPQWVPESYTLAGAFLYIFAPTLTFHFILSFFKNIKAWFKYQRAFWLFKKTHVFSELNEHSLSMAKSLVKEYQQHMLRFWTRPLIVFAGIDEKEDDESSDLVEEAKELGAVLYHKDLESIRFRRRLSLRRVVFYLISEDVPTKLRHATSIMRDYNSRFVTLYVFGDDVRSRLMLGVITVKRMKVVRINAIQSLVYQQLEEHGERLFQHAVEKGGVRVITAVIVGLGRYGTEMLRALTWFCQLEGYRIVIHAFEADEQAEERFYMHYPFLQELNHTSEAGRAQFDIHIHAGVDVGTKAFTDLLQQIPDITYAFISLGNDESNIDTAVHVRSLTERMRMHGKLTAQPDIETIVYDTASTQQFGESWDPQDIKNGEKQGVINHKDQPYRIHMIGDLESFYSTKLVDEKLRQAANEQDDQYKQTVQRAEEEAKEKAAKVATGEATEEEAKAAAEKVEDLTKNEPHPKFGSIEYNVRSSMARALHDRLWQKLTEGKKGEKPDYVEHARWEAYMCAEGYSYSGSLDKSSRNDLALLHHDICPNPIKNLSAAEKAKDTKIKKD